MVKLKNVLLVIKDQLFNPNRKVWRNIIKGHVLGVLSIRSHIRADGKEKQSHKSFNGAKRAAENMEKKLGNTFSVYKCLYCDGWHIGKNRDNK